MSAERVTFLPDPARVTYTPPWTSQLKVGADLLELATKHARDAEGARDIEDWTQAAYENGQATAYAVAGRLVLESLQ